MAVDSAGINSWDGEYDIVVVGYGYAGGVAAIEARDAGCSVLLLEKMPDPGGISICSGGNVRGAEDADEAFTYLKETCAGTTPDDVLKALAIGMTEVVDYFEKLAETSGADVQYRESPGNYPFPGAETFGYASIASVPDYDAAARYPHVNSYVPIHRAAGARLFKVLEDNVEQRDVTVWLKSGAKRLVTNSSGEVAGVTIETEDGDKNIKANRAVILTCGGFEASPEMQLQHWQEKPVLLAAFRGSTGDGIRMAQDTRRRAVAHVELPRRVWFPAPRSGISLWSSTKTAARLDSGEAAPKRREDAMDRRGPHRKAVYERVSAVHARYVGPADVPL